MPGITNVVLLLIKFIEFSEIDLLVENKNDITVFMRYLSYQDTRVKYLFTFVTSQTAVPDS